MPKSHAGPMRPLKGLTHSVPEMRQGVQFVVFGWQPPIERGLGQRVQRQAPRKGPACPCPHKALLGFISLCSPFRGRRTCVLLTLPAQVGRKEMATRPQLGRGSQVDVYISSVGRFAKPDHLLWPIAKLPRELDLCMSVYSSALPRPGTTSSRSA